MKEWPEYVIFAVEVLNPVIVLAMLIIALSASGN